MLLQFRILRQPMLRLVELQSYGPDQRFLERKRDHEQEDSSGHSDPAD
jgi:hypothetical protein